MASIKDAIEECVLDKNSLVKFVIYAIPLFLCAQAIMSGNSPTSSLMIVGITITSILLLGYMLKCTMNTADDSSTRVLPSYNILGVFVLGLKGTIILAPIAIISKLLAGFFIGLLANAPIPERLIMIFSWIIWIILGSFVCTSYLLYTRRGKPFDAYNVSAILKYCIDILLGVIFMKILIALADIVLLLPGGYLLWLFFGLESPISVFILSVIAVFNISVMGHYLAQIGYEIIAVEEEEKAEDKKYAEMEKERLENLKNNNSDDIYNS